MKYIRMKDGIFEIILISPLGFVRIDKRDGTYPDVFEKDIINQVDTIEELCDEFIFDLYGNHRRCHYSPNTKTWVDEESGFDLYEGFVKTIKGAIWTDKGLIYVAKMNNKGELELL